MTKRILSMIAAIVMMILPMHVSAQSDMEIRFEDVPVGHWSDTLVHQLRDLGITNGVSANEFGLGRVITRAEFVTFLVRLKKWDSVLPEKGTFSDVNSSDWYYGSIETAAANSVIEADRTDFRPLDNITREEMAVMIVNTLGYNQLSELYNDNLSSFSDVNDNIGYIELLNSFDIVKGKGDGIFAPKATAKREEAAAILIRMYNKVTSDIKSRNAFYADSSYSQMDKIKNFNSVSFGWAKLTYDEIDDELVLIDRKPIGFEEPLDYAVDNGVRCQLSILASDSTKVADTNTGIITLLLENTALQDKLIDQIIHAVESESAYQGVVIDFEDMVSSDLKNKYSDFLLKLSDELDVGGNTLTVMVQPDLYYKGYDYKSIGAVADQIIIMAHDYSTRQLTEEQQRSGYTFTPVAPIQQVYDTLAALTDSETGVGDRTKISLQVSLASAQWGVKSDQSVYNSVPYQPTSTMIYNRLIKDTTHISFNENTQSPKAQYYNENDALEYIIWYEDSRSIAAKINLAKMFDIEQISVWRLGNIPDYVNANEKPVYMNVLDTILGID